MAFTLTFLKVFAWGIYLMAPLLTMFAALIVLLGQIVGRIEGWKRFDSLYWSFITATTVGYGDIPPTRRPARILAILIAFLGLLFTGLLVSIMLESASASFKEAGDTDRLRGVREVMEPAEPSQP